MEAVSQTPNRLPQIDVLTLGETMLRLTPQGFHRFEHQREMEAHVGGSESNTAVGLARLGHHVCWLSRLTDNPIGRMIANSIAFHGVDCSQVIWTDQDRVGLYFMERGAPPRRSDVIYDRAGSAMSKICPEDLPQDLYDRRFKIFHTSGITLGISESASRTAVFAARQAREHGSLVSFDLNYRAKLWKVEQAVVAMNPMCELADFIFLPGRDVQPLFGINAGQPHEILRRLSAKWPGTRIVLTLGSQGSAMIDLAGQIHQRPAYACTEVERLGGGDAFTAGFLSAILQGMHEDDALSWGNAVASLKYSMPGDFPLVDRSMVHRLTNSDQHAHQGVHR